MKPPTPISSASAILPASWANPLSASERSAGRMSRAGIPPEAALERAVQRLPLGRVAQPDEIANAVLFLASDRASYITGAIVAMDGAVNPMVV